MTAVDDTALGQPTLDVTKTEPGDLILWSVTTLLDILDKMGLNIWNVHAGIRAALRMHDAIPTLLSTRSEDDVIRQIAGARFDRQEGELSDADFGTHIHKMAEQYALTGQRPTADPFTFGYEPDRIAADRCLEQFDAWLQVFAPEYIATEVAVYSERYGYAGTADTFLKIDGVPLIADYKSSKKSYGADGKPTKIYPETALQLAAYRYADLAAVWRPRIHTQFRRRYYVLGPAERDMAAPVPAVEGGLGIKITPDHCYAYPIVCDERVWATFLHLVDVGRFVFNEAHLVIGDPLVPTGTPTSTEEPF